MLGEFLDDYLNLDERIEAAGRVMEDTVLPPVTRTTESYPADTHLKRKNDDSFSRHVLPRKQLEMKRENFHQSLQR